MTPRKKGPHGGRRHGLAPSGRALALLVRLSPDDRAVLEALAGARGEGMAETVRRLIREAAR